MSVVNKNPIKRYKDRGTLGLYHEYRFKDPETGTGCILDHSGNGLHGTLIGSPTWNDGFVFAQGQAITINDNDTGLDSLFNVDDLTFFVIFDEMTSDHDDTINTAGQYREYAFYFGRNNDGAGGTFGHRFYSRYDNTNSKRHLVFDHDEAHTIASDVYGDDNYFPLYDNGHKAAAWSAVKGSAPDIYVQKSFVGDSGDNYNAHLVDTYPDTNDFFVGNFPVNPATDLAQAGYKFPCIDKIQAVVIVQEALDASEVSEVLGYLLAFNSGDLRQQFGTQGGARLEFVYHILGYPYGVATDQTLCDALDTNLALKRKVYGLAAASTYYPADDVPTFDLLYPPGTQQTAVDYQQSKITGGEWKAIISNEPTGYVWPHRVDKDGNDNTTVASLDGIGTLPLVDHDSTILWGRIAADVAVADSDIDIFEKVGGDLDTKIDTANGAGDYTALFLGNETVMVDSVTANGDDPQTHTLNDCIRGAYKSVIEPHFVEEIGEASKLIADAPIGGAAGRYYELFAVPIDDETGAPTDEPFLFRNGQIQNDVRISGDTIEVACGGISTAIEKNVSLDARPGHLARFVLTRPDVGCSEGRLSLVDTPTPHIMITEDGTLENIKNIWLCPMDDTVTFDTLEDLIEAINTELIYCSDSGNSNQQSGSSAVSGNRDEYIELVYKYHATKEGIFVVSPYKQSQFNTGTGLFTTKTRYPKIGGILPWLLGLFAFETKGTNELDDYEVDSIESMGKWYDFITRKHATFNPDDLWTWGKAWRHLMPMPEFPFEIVQAPGGAVADIQYRKGMIPSYGLGRSKYIVMPDFEAVSSRSIIEQSCESNARGMPLQTPLYFETGFDASKFANNVLRLGSDDPNQIYGTVNATTVTQVNDSDEVTVTTGNGHDFSLYPSSPALLYPSADNNGTRSWKAPLYWIPGPENLPDPWQVTLLSSFESDNLGDLMKGVAGDDSGGVDVPERYQLLGVPWLVDDDRGDFFECIDWASVSKFVKRYSANHFYRCDLGTGKFNFGDLFWRELLFHGATPQYTPDFVDRMFKIRVRQIGTANSTLAKWEGRNLDDLSIIGRNNDRVDLVGSARFATVTVKFNWDSLEDKYRTSITINNRNNEQLRVDDALVVESMLSRVNNTVSFSNPDTYKLWAKQINARILNRFRQSTMTYSTRVIADKLWQVQPGTDALITADGVPNMLTGEVGFDDQAIQIVSSRVDFSSPNMAIGVGFSVTPNVEKAIAPSMLVQANNSTKNASKVTITPDAHGFSDVFRRVDMSWFGCFDYDGNTSNDPTDSSNYVARDCDCGYYRVKAFRTDQKEPTVMTFYVRDIDIDAGTCNLYGTTTNWDTTKEYVVLFNSWDTASLADCQKDFLAYGDANNELVDNGGTVTRAPRWV